MRVLGIDPGINGAAAVYEPGRLLAVIDLPTRGDGPRRELDVTRLCAFIGAAQIDAAVIEYVNAMPSIPDKKTGLRRAMGAATIGKMMATYGALKATCEGCGFLPTIVVSQVWKRLYGLNGQEKRQSVYKAWELFGDEARERWLSRVSVDENRCEAALIARWLVERPQPMKRIRQRVVPAIPLFDGLPES